jgi:hypothetical protein
VARVLTGPMFSLEPATSERCLSGTEFRPMRKIPGSLIRILAVTSDVSHGRLLATGKEDLAGKPALDRI